LTADFSFVSTCLGDTTQFYDASTPGPSPITSWQWNFGDGTPIVTGQNPTHIFADTLIYNVRLIVTDSIGATDTVIYQVNIYNCAPPPACYANFIYSVDTATNTVFFTDSSYSPGIIISWNWDFGDGFTDIVQNPTHTYAVFGSYYVCLTITDDSACVDTWCDTVYIGSPPPSCSADWEYFLDTTLNVSFNDLSLNAASWAWDFNNDSINDAFSPTPSWTYGSAGTYNVCLTIWDSLGTCTDTYCQPITVPGGTPPPCSSNFAYSVDTTNTAFFTDVSTSPDSIYDWLWDFGDGFTDVFQNPTHTYGASGSYYVCLTITDDGGCTNTWCDSVSVGSPPPSGCTVIISDSTDASCPGACDGSATASVTVGTAPYNYSWSPVAGINPTITGLCAGTHTVTVTDAGGNTCTASVTISAPPAIVIDSISSTDETCIGCCDGSATANVTGGTGAYTYQWNDGQTGPTAINLCASSYAITVTDSNGCTATDTIIIGSPACSITAGFTSTAPACIGSSVDFTDLSVGATTWAWDFGSGATPSTSTSSNPTGIIYSTSGTKTVNLTISDGVCTDNSIQTITIYPSPTTGIIGTDVSCSGNCDGEAGLTVSNGTAPYTYAWSNGANTEDLTNLCEDTYTVTVTDLNGCSASDSVTVSALNNLVILTSSSEASCAAVCNGTATGIGTGGTSPYTYLWNDPSAQTNSTANFLCSGTYVVTVTDAVGCSDAASVTVNSNPEMILDITTTDATCGNADGNASVVVSNGTLPYTYSWSSGDTISFADNLVSGLYILTVTDAIGCSNFANVNGPVFTGESVTDITCNGGSDGAIIIGVAGGTAPYTYQWSNGNTTQNISNLIAGPYEINVTDFNGCVATQSITVNEPDALDLMISTVDASCGNADGIATVSVSGGTGAYTYQWGAGTGFQTTATATGLGAGVYDVTVTDASGCIDSAAVAVSNINGPLITVDSIIDISCDNPSGGSIYITVTGGYTPYTYLWSNNDITQDLLDIQGGIYDVTVTDTSGCVATASMEIFCVVLPFDHW